MRVSVCLVVVICLTDACSRPIRPTNLNASDGVVVVQAQQRNATAAALMRAGCLDCLVAAFQEYETLRTVPAFADESARGAF